MKNLILCFSSFHVNSDPNNQREVEYLKCYEQLLRVKPSNFDLLFVDNTTSNINSIANNNLKNIINGHKHILYDQNIGVHNKGLGELHMLSIAQQAIDFNHYENVIYLTGRRIITCPYVFEKTEKLNKEALMSNPPIIRIMDGYINDVNHACYNDMFFAMKSNIMIKYIEYAKPFFDNVINTFGSEEILYKFINENSISYEWIESLGFIRNDWNAASSVYNTDYKNFQFC
jgi:hypothetical protein